jgi:hypothetical protein
MGTYIDNTKRWQDSLQEKPCQCGEMMVEVYRLYGYPASSMIKHVNSGEVEVMGCLVPSQKDPIKFHCVSCGETQEKKKSKLSLFSRFF